MSEDKKATTAKELVKRVKELAKKIDEEKVMQFNWVKPKKQINCFIIMPFSEANFTDANGNKRELNEGTLTFIYKEYFLNN